MGYKQAMASRRSILLVLLGLLALAAAPVGSAAGGPPCPHATDHAQDAGGCPPACRHVQVLSEELDSRHFASIDNLNKAGDYIHQTFREHGWRTEEQVYEVDGVAYRNILAHLAHRGRQADLGRTTMPRGQCLAPTTTPAASRVCSADLHRAGATRPVTLAAYTLEETLYYNTEYMGSRCILGASGPKGQRSP